MKLHVAIRSTLPLAALLAGSLLAGCAGTSGPRAGAAAGRTPDIENAALRNDVHLALLDKFGSEALGIAVKVDGDRALLSGEVPSRSTQELAEEVALSVRGIRRVENLLTVDTGESSLATPAGRAVDKADAEVRDAALELRVGQRLLSEIGRYALDLEVEVTDGVVSLRGKLPDEERRRLALRAAEQTPGVQKIINLLQVP
jgi:osmotically-inducible protein OsmY